MHLQRKRHRHVTCTRNHEETHVMANRDYDTRRYLGEDRERWAGRERDFDEGFRGSDMGPRQERGPWQGGQGYSDSRRGLEDYGRGPREDSSLYTRDFGQGHYNQG